VRRLLKEDASYYQELADQEAQVKALEEKIKNGQASTDGNDEFMLKQQKLVVEQTKAVFGPLKQRIEGAIAKLEEQIAEGESSGASAEELEQAKEVLAQSKAGQNGAS